MSLENDVVLRIEGHQIAGIWRFCSPQRTEMWGPNRTISFVNVSHSD